MKQNKKTTLNYCRVCGNSNIEVFMSCQKIKEKSIWDHFDSFCGICAKKDAIMQFWKYEELVK